MLGDDVRKANGKTKRKSQEGERKPEGGGSSTHNERKWRPSVGLPGLFSVMRRLASVYFIARMMFSSAKRKEHVSFISP